MPVYTLSIVVPVYNQENLLSLLCQEVQKVQRELRITIQLILVDDGSHDTSWAKMQAIVGGSHYPNLAITALRLSRNFGQHQALWAGMQEAQGEWVAFMDADLQDNPKYLVPMLKKAQEGPFDVVHTIRQNRTRLFRKLFSKWLHFIFSLGGELKYRKHFGNFKLIHQKVAQAIQTLSTPIPLLEFAIQYVGFRQTALAVVRQKSRDLKSRYSLKKILCFVGRYYIRYSSMPFTAFLILGLVFIGLFWIKGPGFISIPWLLGLLLIELALVGIYLRALQVDSRNWPMFIIAEKLERKPLKKQPP